MLVVDNDHINRYLCYVTFEFVTIRRRYFVAHLGLLCYQIKTGRKSKYKLKFHIILQDVCMTALMQTQVVFVAVVVIVVVVGFVLR